MAGANEDAVVRVVAAPMIEKRIFVVRERQVMLDEDLADLYGVETKRLTQQVKRNLKRFPVGAEVLRSQIATSNDSRGGRRYPPSFFTEQGVAMLSGCGGDRAIAVLGALRQLIAPPSGPRRPIGFRVRDED